MHLPKRFNIWAGQKLSLWQEDGGANFPTLEVYIDLLLDQDKILERHEASQTNTTTPNVSNITVNNRKDTKRLSKNQRKRLNSKFRKNSAGNSVGTSNGQNNVQSNGVPVNAFAFQGNKTQNNPGSKQNWGRPRNSTPSGGQGRGGSGAQGQTNNFPKAARSQGHSAAARNPSSTGRPPITCKRCLSRNGHTSDQCPSTNKCSFCNNWSHAWDHCTKRPRD